LEKKYTNIILPQLKKDTSKEKRKENKHPTSFLLPFFIDLIDLIMTRCGVHHNKQSTEKLTTNGLLRGTAPSPAPALPLRDPSLQ
jgi:hypothetical protein